MSSLAGVAVVVLGGGNMGGALVAGLVRAGWPVADVAVVEPKAARREELARLHLGLDVVERAEGPWVHSWRGAGVVVAVKPEEAAAACRTATALEASRVVSVVSGVACQRLEGWLAPSTPVVRAVPNTPALIGAGVTAMAGGSHVRGADLDWAEKLLGSLGRVLRLPERHLDAVTALSGSGPAYVFVVAEALVDAGVTAGLPRDVAVTLVTETLRGASLLLAAHDGDAPGLRAQVTSPGGTTAAGLRALEARAVRSAFLEAVASATERARQLGHGA